MAPTAYISYVLDPHYKAVLLIQKGVVLLSEFGHILWESIILTILAVIIINH